MFPMVMFSIIHVLVFIIQVTLGKKLSNYMYLYLIFIERRREGRGEKDFFDKGADPGFLKGGLSQEQVCANFPNPLKICHSQGQIS